MVFLLADDLYHLRGLLLGDAPERDGHLLLKPGFDVRRGVLAKLDCLLLPGSVHPMVCLNDVRASLKAFLAESAHPALLARLVAVFLDHGLDVLHEVPYQPFPLPACGLRQSTGARCRHD